MMHVIRAALTVLLLSAVAHSDEFQDGVAAYQGGDSARAVAIWSLLAEAGERDAQFNVGIIHARGLGVPVDRAAAIDWLSRAAGQGDIIAAYNLGIIYSDAETETSNFSRAVEWYEQAAAREHPGAMENLSLLLANGQGVQQDLSRAVRLATLSEELECLVGDTSQNYKPRLSRLKL